MMGHVGPSNDKRRGRDQQLREGAQKVRQARAAQGEEGEARRRRVAGALQVGVIVVVALAIVVAIVLFSHGL